MRNMEESLPTTYIQSHSSLEKEKRKSKMKKLLVLFLATICYKAGFSVQEEATVTTTCTNDWQECPYPSTDDYDFDQCFSARNSTYQSSVWDTCIYFHKTNTNSYGHRVPYHKPPSQCSYHCGSNCPNFSCIPCTQNVCPKKLEEPWSTPKCFEGVKAGADCICGQGSEWEEVCSIGTHCERFSTGWTCATYFDD